MRGRGRARLIVLLVVSLYVPACARSLYHQVRSGDTLSEIGQRYGVPYQEIARVNNIRNPDRIEVGQWLRIPPPQKGRSPTPPRPEQRSATLAPSRSRELRPVLSPEKRRPERGDIFFAWPVEGRLTSGFGPRNGSFHDGIDIAAPLGTTIVAAADGQVIFSDELRGYGNVVIVRHGNGYVTVYAHNRVNHVREGQYVRRGERVAEVGMTGRASGPSLHFEVRKDNLARDPLRYLSQERRTVVESHLP